jgi:hypothetical protein
MVMFRLIAAAPINPGSTRYAIDAGLRPDSPTGSNSIAPRHGELRCISVDSRRERRLGETAGGFILTDGKWRARRDSNS